MNTKLQITAQIRRLFLIKNKENYINEVAIIKQRIHTLKHHDRVYYFKLLAYAKLQIKMERSNYHVLGNQSISEAISKLQGVKPSFKPRKPLKWA